MKGIDLTAGRIAEANEKDLSEILKLQKKAFEMVAVKENNFDIQPLKQTYEEIVQEFAKRKFIKYVLNGAIVGSVRGHADEQNICYVGKLIVHPDFQNAGIGTALMKELERHFSTCSSFEIFTSQNSENTLSLYKKLGYTERYVRKVDNVSIVFMKRENI
ncbi:ribosomal protein S18 acetylase RimI-like enzyme [Ruminiclostridium sufflavum DSM 19573]|uniref:Ribosomal protein S18 acetylase RimI-like enzyme n=1 Tax=Ruminiclostridium sufflavum DSM 19573 TaxID=1121337 RepID=A0A318XUC5_9FIRM|nr:GNAT family N-acetyltransferase [Ruminiclostridium sufflavum]PYG90240.1 ribosomal protein S18 acetylase RimI-like enzyme [Ruminiclostridium sufflavum DSM 19573]